MTDAIPRAQLKARFAYLLHSRNLTVGVYDGNGGFTGVRRKMGATFLDTEFLNDPPGRGTAIALREIAPLPPEIEVKEGEHGPCADCGQPIVYDEEFRPGSVTAQGAKKEARPWPWRHLTVTGSIQPLSQETHEGGGTYRTYKPLFEWLKDLETLDQPPKEV